MGVPTAASRPPVISTVVEEILTLVDQIKSDAETWITELAAGDVEISYILDTIYKPYASALNQGGYLATIQDARAQGAFNRAYLGTIGLYFEFGSSEVNLANSRLQIGGNNFAINDRIRFEEKNTLPVTNPQIAEGTNYYVLAKPNPTTITIETEPGGGAGTAIDIIGVGEGINAVRYAVVGDFNNLESALEAVIDEIIAVVPTEATTAELLAQRFDKALVNSDTGLEQLVLTSIETATLRTRLQAVADAVEASV